jgi:hypothetical protein
MDTFDYTISSVDYEHNNRIYTNITGPQTEYCKLTITSLTTMANFVVLDKNDYITINDHTYRIQEDFSDVNTASLVEYLNGIMAGSDVEAYYDSCSRIYFMSTNDITISACSYNLKLMLGLVNVSLPWSTTDGTEPLGAVTKVLLCPDVGLYLSTPVLYLACNLGSKSYRTSNSGFTSMRILMRLTNSFFAKQPINNPNGDFTTTVRCSDLSDVRFTLIDANYHEVKLLSPMYLTVQLEAIPDTETDPTALRSASMPPLVMGPAAYLRDLTERGQEYSESDLELVFVMPDVTGSVPSQPSNT